jgi:hypothetical protein
MAEYCESRGITIDELRERRQRPEVVERRREFARLCEAQRIGRTVIAAALHMDGSTVATYLRPHMIAQKAKWTRARRLAQKCIAIPVALPYGNGHERDHADGGAGAQGDATECGCDGCVR